MARARRTHRVRVQLADALGAMSESQILCRDFGHSWRPFSAEWIPQHRQYQEILRCARCKTGRVRLLAENGQLLGNRYVYSDGYLVSGVGRLTEDDRNDLRLSALQTVLDIVERSTTKKAG